MRRFRIVTAHRAGYQLAAQARRSAVSVPELSIPQELVETFDHFLPKYHIRRARQDSGNPRQYWAWFSFKSEI
jgi:hypothetical protein